MVIFQVIFFIKMYTTRKKEAGLNNCWPLLTETGLEDNKEDLLFFCKISNKVDKNTFKTNKLDNYSLNFIKTNVNNSSEVVLSGNFI